MSIRTMISYSIATLLSVILVLVTTTFNPGQTPKEVYRVYLKGESIGLINSKEELENYIDQEQSHLKDEYKVDKVYAPNDLDIEKEITFEDKTLSTQEIYEIIKDKSPFTIQGYKIFIQGIEEQNEEGENEKQEDQVLYVLDKNIFLNSVHKTAETFIDKDELAAYEQDKQQPIVDTGKIIENVYIQNEQTITQENISVNEKIFTTEEELSQYLLFGTNEKQDTYIVQEGDTVDNISFDHQLSTDEFIIANPTIKADTMLFPGQEVSIGVLQPQLNIVEETHVVSRQTIGYNTVYENDPDKYAGEEVVKQEGMEGVQLVTQKIKLVNGETKSVVPIDTQEEKPSVDRIIVRGTKQRSVGGGIGSEVEVPVGIGSWVWPTITPYQIMSYFAYRWGKLHKAIDIAGCGEGSPIKAANNGVVVYSGYNGTNGNYIYIKHSNGQYTEYAHMAVRYKKAGDVVYAGDIIGTMGHTGFAQGTHLHFGLWNGYPFRGTPVNPLTLFQ